TALIPVVMYTSEQGDVYVGQARALGALDIISKEVIQHSSIEKVLSSLGIPALDASADSSSERASKRTPDTRSPQRDATGARRTSSMEQWGDDAGNKPGADYVATTDLNKVQAQVGKLFEIHIAKVRQEMEDNTKFLMRRLSKEIQDKAAPKVGAPVKALPADSDGAEPRDLAEQPAPARLMPALVVTAVIAALVFLGYQALQSLQAQQLAATNVQQLADKLGEQGAVVDQVFETLIAQQSAPKSGADGRVMLDALGWAVNVNPTVPFGDKALNDERIYMLGELLALLKAANFSGTVFIDVHLGDYCVVEGATGEWVLPEPSASLDDCTYLAASQADTNLNDHVSVGFLNYLHSTPVLTDGGISVEMTSMGFDSPRYSYPPMTSATSAGEWNQAAARNSRLAFSFSPE
ncbi:MAG TPA: hypothetical protein VIC26_14055, partial [Marinagarivorans sp.]